jgi:nitrate/TMAO reductase-like tetraheme cytochrome c subunit
MVRKLVSWIPRFWVSRLATVGVAITTAAGCTLLLLLAAEFATAGMPGYASGLFVALALGFFMFGLALIPAGLLLHRWRHKGEVERPAGTGPWSTLFGNKSARRTILVLGIATVINLVLIGGGGYTAAKYMDSPQFCGTTCHTVMEPEYQAYLRSPHSRVKCVDCHIGPGASWAVRSKIDGLRQVWNVIIDDYSRPTPAPVHELRPARGTCEKCHWPDKFYGNRLISRMHFEEDAENTAVVTILALKVGGALAHGDRHEGIHWHVSPNTQVEYEALDDKREKIGRIRVLRDGEVVKEFLPPKELLEEKAHEIRTMDCVDCHNRPTHQFDGTPVQAVEWALEHGVLDPSTPYLRKLAPEILAREDRPRDGVEKEFLKDLSAAYDTQFPDVKPDEAALEKAAAGMATMYRRNIFPYMRVGWDTYPTHIGHAGEMQDLRGCFRCHDEKHKTADGQALSQDCEMCHQLLAQEEKPSELEESLKTMLGWIDDGE